MNLLKFLSIILFASFILTSCEKAEEEAALDCDFVAELCEIKPFCVWPPAVNTPIPLPVAFYYNGQPASHEDFKFEWSSDPTFGGSAISLRYEHLPVTLKVTEIATDCVVEVTLEI